MLRIACVIIAFFAWHSNPVGAGEIRSELLPSKALGRQLPYLIYLPDAYMKGQDYYPVLYLLHGAGGDERGWATHGHIKEQADFLIASGVIPPAIIVMPGCPASWWVDGAKEQTETAFWSAVVPTIATRYRTIEKRGGRLVAGFSAGGYGAVRFALRYPDRIAAAAALSPAVYTGPIPQKSSAWTQPPFLGADGQFDRAVWDRLNYPPLLEKYFAQPRRVPLYLVSGNSDEYGITSETVVLFKRLFARQPAQTELRVVEGGHNWDLWEANMAAAMQYIFQFADKPHPAERPAGLLAGFTH